MAAPLMPIKIPTPKRDARRAAILMELCALALLFAGCASHNEAVVEERSTNGARPPPKVVVQTAPVPGPPAIVEAPPYTVKRGDTLYLIALDHGLDYKDIAAWNNIERPNRISVGQVLRMGPPQPVTVDSGAVGNAQVGVVAPYQSIEARPLGGPGASPLPPPPPSQVQASSVANTSTFKTSPKTGKEPYSDQAAAAVAGGTQVATLESKPETRAAADDDDHIDWGWPVRGKMLGAFSEATNKGVDIAGKVGEPVVASASGKVILAGNALRGYGKLIIIKHNATYLSVYAHNNEILVKEGQTIVKGQKIAEVGSTDADQPMLHFEIRKQGKPVDPLKYLPPAS